ncbi:MULTISPECIES: hypothetical protein [Caballeronia]|uniref:Uncharacterized protein n=1 Tax=Caballeronia concitans TaxID=1777133 RepID=A0A658QZA7_9BURK|nr:hypothetical protein [Caballeronia concitans]SAL34832.1 hypothetical protein AWB72_03349 [Caballeronia concitans]
MKLAVLEVRYAGGLILTDRVVVQASSGILLPPRLSAMLTELEKTEHRTSIRVSVDGVIYRVTGAPDGEFAVGAKLPFGERLVTTLKSVATPNRAQRRLNRRFAHMLSAFSLIGACYLVQSSKDWDAGVIVETALLCVTSAALFIIGHMCFPGDHEST